jgi:hypothetical protein
MNYKCIFCQRDMVFEDASAVSTTTGKNATCKNHNRPMSTSANFPVGYWLYAETVPYEEVTSYVMNLPIGDALYGFDSYKDYRGKPRTDIYYLQKIIPTLLVTYSAFTPLSDDLVFYEKAIKRVLNLKAFL